MSIAELVRKNRSYRRFDEKSAIDRETLEALVELARLSGTGGNVQPLKFVLSWTPERNAAIFPSLAWAGYLQDWDGPAEGERPTAYVVICGDSTIKKGFGCDHGIAAQSILLGAVERGLGGCMIGSIDRHRLHKDLGLADTLEILLVIALGRPAEQVVVEPVGPDGDIKYWRDAEGVHHVPKRALDELIVEP